MRHQIWLLVCVLLCIGVYSTETGELIEPTAGAHTPKENTKTSEWPPSLYETVRALPIKVLSPPLELREFTSSPIMYEWKGTVGEAFDGPMMKDFPEAIELVSNSAIRELCAENGVIHISGMDWKPDPNFPLEMILDTEREQEKHNEIFKHCRLVSWVLRESLHSKWHITYQDMRHSLFEVGVFDIDSDDHEWLQKEDDSWWITPHGKGGDPILFYDMQYPPDFQQYQIARKKLREAVDETLKRFTETIQQQKLEMEELSKPIREMEQDGASAAPQPLVSNIKELVQNTNHYVKLAQELTAEESRTETI